LLNFTASNDYRIVSLRDCTVNDISQENDDVIFEFNDGFWLLETNDPNQFERAARTDKSTLRFTNVNLEASDI